MAVETIPAELAAAVDDEPRRAAPVSDRGRKLRLAVLFLGAFVFLFPFYYMIIGSLQADPDTGLAGALPNPSNLTLDNYAQINDQLSLARALFNSGVFTGAVILGTVVFGLLAGYALAVLSFRGRGTVFASLLLVQVVPFQLLTIPLYVLIVRDYGLADSYLGMILPFAINSTAVFVFRQFFLQLPRELFDAARIDGASELTILLRIAVPLSKPALLTAVLLTFIGPWNEFLWPFLVTKQQEMQPLAVALANYISTVSGRASNPFGAILAGACVLAAPAIALFVVFQKRFVQSNLGSGVKG
jgi:multiple sugar transport system permease protein